MDEKILKARQALSDLSAGKENLTTFDPNNVVIAQHEETPEAPAANTPGAPEANTGATIISPSGEQIPPAEINAILQEQANLARMVETLATALEQRGPGTTTHPEGIRTPNAATPGAPSGTVVQQTTQGAGVTNPVAGSIVEVNLQDPNVMVITKDGRRIPGKQAEGEMMLQSKFSAEQRKLLESARAVKAQEHILDAASKSAFGAIFMQALTQGKTEDEAIQLGLLAANKTLSGTTQQKANEVEPPIPSEDDVDYTKKLLARQAWENANAMKVALAPMNKFLQTLPNPEQLQQQERQRGEIVSHNTDLFTAYIDPCVPAGLNKAQTAYVLDYVRAVAQQEDIPLDPASYSSEKLSVSDIKLIQRTAFPGGQLPPQVTAHLETLNPTTNVLNPQVQQTTAAHPVNAGQPSPGTTVIPQNAQAAGIYQQIREMQGKIAGLAEQIGAAPPRVPTQPVAQAAPNSNSLQVPAGTFAENQGDRVQRQLRSLKYAE